ncbi:MAG: hypothetical protein KAT32_05220 [Candidatus Moranbacteria bacterium]|nr:hypothetical protein [Candidatus Moranbacteria bacterium]
MINYKLKKDLTGNENWPRFSTIHVKGVSGEQELKSNDDEKTIQSWKNVAVMKATSSSSVKFYLGFYNEKEIVYLKNKFETNLTFAMRISSKDMNFFVMPKDLNEKIELELVEITIEDDSKYDNLILI